MPLTDTQLKYIDAIDWLISDEPFQDRATGRTWLLAYCFIRRAMRQPNTWIRVWDHRSYFVENEKLIIKIMPLIIEHEFPDFITKFRYNVTHKSIMIVG